MAKAFFKDILNEEDRKAFDKGGYGTRMGYGVKPALLIVDATYSFVDPSFAQASGDRGWKAVTAIKSLISLCRTKGVPIVYTRPFPRTAEYLGHKFGISRKQPLKAVPPGKGDEIVEEIAPILPDDAVIFKLKSSAFFQTGLVSLLNYHGVDTLIVTGATTSGCIRATVVDGASYGYYVIVPEEAVADRAALSHKVNLLDMDMKYADVELLESVLRYLQELPDEKG